MFKLLCAERDPCSSSLLCSGLSASCRAWGGGGGGGILAGVSGNAPLLLCSQPKLVFALGASANNLQQTLSHVSPLQPGRPNTTLQ